jgi:hypothetical protein
VALIAGWSLVSWQGPDTAIEDVVTAGSGVTAIYTWDNAAQDWLAYFPGETAPGVNDLTQLEEDRPYWIASSTPGTLAWGAAAD